MPLLIRQAPSSVFKTRLKTHFYSFAFQPRIKIQFVVVFLLLLSVCFYFTVCFYGFRFLFMFL